MRLANKIAIVTGAGSGFGRGIATRFSAEGARVVVNDIHEPHGRETADALGAAARFCAGNVACDRDVKRLVDCALAEFGGLTTVVNNAGTTHRNQPMLDVTEEGRGKDPWGGDYVYLNPGIRGEIDVVSYGADRQPGGEGYNADIGSWDTG